MSVLNQSIIKHKMGLLNLAEELRNVSQACRVMGVSRDTFYRVKEARESGGMDALLHKDRRRANFKNRVDETVEHAVLAFALENPAAGQVQISHRVRPEDAERVQPLGRDVEVAVRRVRRRTDEEDVLVPDEFDQPIVQPLVNLALYALA